ncbi:hypothetical protein PaeBR_17025 [Paenibacillus sp. BR2-3]|uniref:hypothetical protein n=1 Tax=Paenibacillus sp. BR2-3 TaxID=3048494 RepID=UPI003977C84B
MYKDTVLVIEVKGYRVRKDVTKDFARKEGVEHSRQKNIEKPLTQIKTVMNDLVENKIHKELNKDKKYYFMAVNMDNLPTSNFMSANSHDEFVSSNNVLNIKGLFSLSLEEFELFTEIISSMNKSFGEILDDYYDKFYGMALKNYFNRILRQIPDYHKKGPLISLKNEAEIKLNTFFSEL